MTEKAETCFKLVKYLDSPSYLTYMLNLPTMMGVDSVDSTFLIWDNPHTGESKVVKKKDMAVEEYQKWLTDLVEKYVTSMPEEVKTAILRDQRHLL
jgi:hypothetical protein